MPTVPRVKQLSLSIFRNFRNDPINYLGGLRERYGDICHIKKFGQEFYFGYSPQFAEHVLFSNQNNYSKIDNYKTYYPVFGKNSLFITNDLDQWNHDRKLAETSLDLKVHAADYVKVFFEKCSELVDRIQDRMGDAAKPVSVPIEDELTTLLFQIIQNTIFCDLDIDSTQFPHLKDECHNLICDKSASLGLLWMLPTKRNRRYRYLVKYMKEIRDRMLTSRLKSKIDYDDVLGAFLKGHKVTDELTPGFQAVATQMMTFNLIGQQEASSTLLWAIIALSQHPEISEKIASELDVTCEKELPTYEECAKLVYCRAFISEVLRLHPPLFMVVRQAISNDEVMGYPISAKAKVGIPLCCLHRHPDYWDNPDEFIPERFLDRPWGQDNEFAYMPFIVGNRNCVARNFILLAMSLITGILVKNFKFSLPAGFRPERNKSFLVYDRPNLERVLVQARH